MCSLFRNESPALSNDLIGKAVAATRWYWPEVPEEGMITMIDASKIKSVNPGYCYKMAGFQHVGKTQGGLLVLQLLPQAMPELYMPLGAKAKRIELARHLKQFALIAN